MIPAKKSLGQNFLKSKEALRALIEAGSVTSDNTILEVGPGKGVLTEELVKLAKKVIAVEKDDRLIELLREKFTTEIAEGTLELLHQDILEFDPTSLVYKNGLLPSKGESLSSELPEKQIEENSPLEGSTAKQEGCYKIIANIPYYITGTFLQKFLETDFQPSKMVLMVQKEVAQRIVAKDGKESILSMSVKAYGEPKYIMTVKAKYFSPAPKVDSTIILIDSISKSFFTNAPRESAPSLTLEDSLSTQEHIPASHFSEQKFFDIIKLGFAHKRKMLIGNLSEKYPREKLVALFSGLGINEKARAEDLSLSDFKKLIIEL